MLMRDRLLSEGHRLPIELAFLQIQLPGSAERWLFSRYDRYGRENQQDCPDSAIFHNIQGLLLLLGFVHGVF